MENANVVRSKIICLYDRYYIGKFYDNQYLRQGDINCCLLGREASIKLMIDKKKMLTIL